MSIAAVGKLLPQLDEFQAQRFDAGDESVQRGPVGRSSHQHGAGGGTSVASSGCRAVFRAGVSRPLIRKA